MFRCQIFCSATVRQRSDRHPNCQFSQDLKAYKYPRVGFNFMCLLCASPYLVLGDICHHSASAPWVLRDPVVEVARVDAPADDQSCVIGACAICGVVLDNTRVLPEGGVTCCDSYTQGFDSYGRFRCSRVVRSDGRDTCCLDTCVWQ